MPYLRGSEADAYNPPMLSNAQVGEVEEVIWTSEDVDAWVKPLFIWMLRQTDNLTQEVVLTLSDSDVRKEKIEDFQHSAHDIISSNGLSHLNTLLGSMGTEMGINHHSGGFVKNTGEQDDFDSYLEPHRTVWFCYRSYSRKAKRLSFPGVNELQVIQLEHDAVH